MRRPASVVKNSPVMFASCQCTADTKDMEVGDVFTLDTLLDVSADLDADIQLREVVTGDLAFVAGESYTISSMGSSNGEITEATYSETQTDTYDRDASAISRAVSGLGDTDTLAVGTTFTIDVDANDAEMAHINSLTSGMTFIKVSDTLNDIDGPNKDAEFNLAHLPSDAVVARSMGAAAETGRVGSSGLEAEKTYIVRTVGTAGNYQDGQGNKGGDILYRWGNPANYGRGDNSDQKLNAQHGVYWIPLGYPGAGKLLIFNNNPSDTLSNSNQFGNSSVVEVLPPINSDGEYFLTPDSIYGPENFDLIYGNDDSFYSSFQSGAYRLKNGNTIITVTQEKSIFEINQDNQVVWECKIDSLINENGFTARAKKYNINYLDSIIGDVYTDNKLNVYDVIKTSDIIFENQPQLFLVFSYLCSQIMKNLATGCSYLSFHNLILILHHYLRLLLTHMFQYCVRDWRIMIPLLLNDVVRLLTNIGL